MDRSSSRTSKILIDIIDNFLEPYEFDILQDQMFGADENGYAQMDWWACDHINSPEDDHFQFVHQFYGYNQFVSNRSNYVYPVLEKIPNLLTLMRVKANLLTKTPEHIFHGYHVDMADAQGLPHKTAIFYCNTTNGWTQFEDDTKVECIANRMIIFDGQLKHSSVSQTDEKFRVVMNINYIESDYGNEA